MADNNFRIRVGSKLKLGDGDTYEIVDFYYEIDKEGGFYTGIVETKDSNGKIDKNFMSDMLALLQTGELYNPESKSSADYYKNVVKPRFDKQRSQL